MNYKKIKLNKILDLIKNIKKDDKIIEIGCECGEVTSFLNEKGYNIKGIDINPKVISKAKKTFPKAKFEVKDAKKINYSKYKLIIAWGIFEYINNTKNLLEKIEREMKINSYLIFTIPNVCSFSRRIKCLIGKNPNKETKFHKTYTIKQIKKLINETNFKKKIITSLYVDCIKNFCFPTTKKTSANIIVKLKK